MKRLFPGALLGLCIALSLLATPTAFAQLATAEDVTQADFHIYRSDGTPATMDDVRAALGRADVVFVGELHNDPVSHYIEQRVLEAWFDEHGHAAALSLEMFARDVQYIVDEYLAGLITDSAFQQSSSPWSNYETDYRPLVEFAKERGLPVIAANAPRRYSNMVSRGGRTALDALSDQARSHLAPLPYGAPSEAYTAQWNQVMADAMQAMREAQAEAEAADEHEGMDHGDMEHGAEGHEGMDHGEMDHGAEGHEGMDHGEMDHGAEGHEGMDHGEMDHGAEGHEGMNHGEGEMDHAAMREKHHPDMSDEEYEKMKAERMAAKKDGEGMQHGEGHEMGEGMQHGEGHEMGAAMSHGEGGHSCPMMAEGGECKRMEGEMEGMDHGAMDHGAEGHEGMDHGDMNHGAEGHEGMDHGDMEHGEMNHDAEEHAAPSHEAPAAQPQHGGGSMLDAQALWDATMAWSIAEHMTRTPGAKVAHFVGGFHVESGTGTPEHLIQYRPGTRMVIISVQSVDDPATFDPEEHTGLGDFVVLGDSALPRTYETRTR